MAKLTETFNDKAKANGGFPHIVANHEPLPGEAFEAFKNLPGAPLLKTPDAEQPKPQEAAQELKIAMIGTAPSSRLLAPFNDPSWTIWACSPGNMQGLPRVDAWFELHGNLLWKENAHYGAPYIDWMKRLTIPVYMQDQRYLPNAVSFPMAEMVKEFGRDFFTSSFTWMMAFAISKGAKEIALYGIDMASRDEYILQRPGFFFFRHMAQQRGIKVSAPHESDIMQSPGLYGYSDVTPMGRKILAREQELKDRLAPMRNQAAELQRNIAYLEGACEDIDYFKSIWMGQGSVLPEGG